MHTQTLYLSPPPLSLSLSLSHTHTHTHATLTHVKHLDKMKSCDDTYGQALALENIAKTYEYMANLTKACESLGQVSSQMEPVR